MAKTTRVKSKTIRGFKERGAVAEGGDAPNGTVPKNQRHSREKRRGVIEQDKPLLMGGTQRAGGGTITSHPLKGKIGGRGKNKKNLGEKKLRKGNLYRRKLCRWQLKPRSPEEQVGKVARKRRRAKNTIRQNRCQKEGSTYERKTEKKYAHALYRRRTLKKRQEKPAVKLGRPAGEVAHRR